MKSWADAFCCSPGLLEASLGSFCGTDGNSEDSGMTGIVEVVLVFGSQKMKMVIFVSSLLMEIWIK